MGGADGFEDSVDFRAVVVGRGIRGERGGRKEGEKLAALHGADGSVLAEAGQIPTSGGRSFPGGNEGRFAAEKGLATVGGTGLFSERGKPLKK